jgi:hypothetical protein
MNIATASIDVNGVVTLYITTASPYILDITMNRNVTRCGG